MNYSLTNPYLSSATFWTYFFSPFSSSSDERFKGQTLQEVNNGNVQTYDQEESKLNSTINTKSGAQTLTNDKIIKNPSNKNDAAAIKSNLNSNKTLITRAC